MRNGLSVWIAPLLVGFVFSGIIPATLQTYQLRAAFPDWSVVTWAWTTLFITNGKVGCLGGLASLLTWGLLKNCGICVPPLRMSLAIWTACLVVLPYGILTTCTTSASWGASSIVFYFVPGLIGGCATLLTLTLVQRRLMQYKTAAIGTKHDIQRSQS